MSEGVALREALRLGPLVRARVVAGAAGLDRLVSQVNMMEVPDILPWVKPQQLLLTTTYPLRDNPEALRALVPGLAARGLAGLAIKPARYIDAIPEVMIEAADRLDFPLIELPPEASFDEVISAVFGSILNAQAIRLQRSAAIHDRFTRIVLSGGGLREIAQTLSELIDRPVAIVDPDGTVLAISAGAARQGLGPPGSRGALTYADGDVDAGHRLQRATFRPALTPNPSPTCGRGEHEVNVAVQPVQVDGERHGAIVVLADAGDVGEDGLVAVEQAATIAALRLVQARVLAEGDRRFQAVCLEELVAGHMVDRGVLHERSLAFGWDLTVPRAALVAELEELGGRRFCQLAGTTEEGRAWHRLAEAVTSTLGKDAIVWERSAGVAALVPPGRQGRAALLGAATALQGEAARRLPGSVVAVGIGRICTDPLELAASHREALRALAVGRRTRGSGHVSLFEDLGVDRLLAGCAGGELVAFRDTMLGRLLSYDAAHQTELVATLEAFLGQSGNATLAARALFVHYNTLRHRLHTIEHVLGLSLDDAEARLSLGLALRVLRMLPS